MSSQSVFPASFHLSIFPVSSPHISFLSSMKRRVLAIEASNLQKGHVQPPKRSCPPRLCLKPLHHGIGTRLDFLRMSSRPGLLGAFQDARPTRPCQPTGRFLAPRFSGATGLQGATCQWRTANAARQRCTWQLTVAKACTKSELILIARIASQWGFQFVAHAGQRTCTQMCTFLAKLWKSSTLTKADTKPQTPTTQVITEGSWSATMGIPRKSATIWSSFQAALHPRVVQGLWHYGAV